MNKEFVAWEKFRLSLETTKQPTLIATEDINAPNDMKTSLEGSAEPNLPASNASEIIMLSDSNSSFSSLETITTESNNTVDLTSNYNDDQSQDTTLSYNFFDISQSVKFGFSTAPNSPTQTNSSASFVTTTPSNKEKKSGRPRKEHSARPDPSYLARLSTRERKYLEGRYKNNEACRKSRFRSRQREEAEKMEEQALQRKNAQLKTKLLKYLHISETLNNIANKKI
ncbi:uncharacterized protein LOC119683253 [Teleopsis dalmanni]|uniref:uncharacterized protein LOC119683253 n=1 Tax=Teleopsis dalmanni TaxID=139649 RepID=UPI0018CD321F|nr:uncharacterized protein LOC119683253 [Teleopsis dalmanni]